MAEWAWLWRYSGGRGRRSLGDRLGDNGLRFWIGWEVYVLEKTGAGEGREMDLVVVVMGNGVRGELLTWERK